MATHSAPKTENADFAWCPTLCPSPDEHSAACASRQWAAYEAEEDCTAGCCVCGECAELLRQDEIDMRIKEEG